MTRINVIDPALLTDAHLLAERRELPRIYDAARPDPLAPSRYVLGAGHVRFFYDKVGWLVRREAALVAECLARGFRVRTSIGPRSGAAPESRWEPDADAVGANLARLRDRLSANPAAHRVRGAPAPGDWYARLLT